MCSRLIAKNVSTALSLCLMIGLPADAADAFGKQLQPSPSNTRATSKTKQFNSRIASVSNDLPSRQPVVRRQATHKFLADGPAGKDAEAYPEFRHTLWKPKGQPKGSIILLSPWDAEKRWWVEWLKFDFNKLMKDYRVLECSGKDMVHTNATYTGWYAYEDWEAEVPLAADLDRATSFVHSLIQQERRIVNDYHRIIVAGFSQGAVLALESGLRFPHPLGLVFSQRGMLFAARRRDCGSPAQTPYCMTAGSEDNVYPDYEVEDDVRLLRKAKVPAFWNRIPGLDHYGTSKKENELLMRAVQAALSQDPPQSIKALAKLDSWEE